MEQHWSVLWTSEISSIFEEKILSIIRPASNSVYNCPISKGTKLITSTRSSLDPSHLRGHKFKYSFQNSINLFVLHVYCWWTSSFYFLLCSVNIDLYKKYCRLAAWEGWNVLSFWSILSLQYVKRIGFFRNRAVLQVMIGHLHDHSRGFWETYG